MTGELDQAVAAVYEEARQALRTFRYDRVFALMNELLRDYPQASEPFVYIAQANLRLGTPQEAVDALGEAVRRDDGNRQAHAMLCFMLGLQGDEERAAREFEAAIAGAPSPGVRLWCAAYLLEVDELDGALQYAEDGVALDPANAELYELLGRIFLALEEPDAAFEMFRKALWLDPGDAVTLNNIGFLLLRMGERSEAFDYFWQALQAAPGFRIARRNVWLTARTRHPVIGWAFFLVMEWVRLAPIMMPLGLTLLCMGKALIKARLFRFDPLFPAAQVFALLTMGLFLVDPVLSFVLRRGWLRFLR